jgi:TRAP-type C4-dicarboxylate transport system permease small subunit
MHLAAREELMTALYKAIAERWAVVAAHVLRDARWTMFVEVVRREVFSYSSIWGEEIVRYSFIYLAWIGAACRGQRARPHSASM